MKWIPFSSIKWSIPRGPDFSRSQFKSRERLLFHTTPITIFLHFPTILIPAMYVYVASTVWCFSKIEISEIALAFFFLNVNNQYGTIWNNGYHDALNSAFSEFVLLTTTTTRRKASIIPKRVTAVWIKSDYYSSFLSFFLFIYIFCSFVVFVDNVSDFWHHPSGSGSFNADHFLSVEVNRWITTNFTNNITIRNTELYLYFYQWMYIFYYVTF